MSTNDVELKDLLIQALELNGGLAKIRAQLRACIFKVLNEDDKTSKEPQFVNNKIQHYLDDPDGRLMFSIVRNFLEYFDFNCTLSVFEQECRLNQCNSEENQEEIIKKLSAHQANDRNSNNGPILMELIKVLKLEHNNNNDKTVNESINRTYDINSPTILNKESQSTVLEDKENCHKSEGNHQTDSKLDSQSNKDDKSCGDSNGTYEEDFTGDTLHHSSKNGKDNSNATVEEVENTSNNSITTTEA